MPVKCWIECRQASEKRVCWASERRRANNVFRVMRAMFVGVCCCSLDNKQSLLYSVSKAGALLDYAPQTSLAEGIKHFADWYKGYFNVVQTPSADESWSKQIDCNQLCRCRLVSHLQTSGVTRNKHYHNKKLQGLAKESRRNHRQCDLLLWLSASKIQAQHL
jgi:hypothetical protein